MRDEQPAVQVTINTSESAADTEEFRKRGGAADLATFMNENDLVRPEGKDRKRRSPADIYRQRKDEFGNRRIAKYGKLWVGTETEQKKEIRGGG